MFLALVFHWVTNLLSLNHIIFFSSFYLLSNFVSTNTWIFIVTKVVFFCLYFLALVRVLGFNVMIDVCPWQVMSYEALKDVTEYGRQKWIPNSNWHVNSSLEGLLLGGLAGGMFLPCASI